MGQITRTNFGCSKILSYNNAAIKALADRTVTLLAGIAGKIILPHIVCYTLKPWVADYTNIDVTANVEVNINGVFTPPTLTGGGLLAQGHANIIWSELGRDYDGTPYNYNNLVGQPLTLTITNGGAGDFTGGDISTILTVQVFYEVLKAV